MGGKTYIIQVTLLTDNLQCDKSVAILKAFSNEIVFVSYL